MTTTFKTTIDDLHKVLRIVGTMLEEPFVDLSCSDDVLTAISNDGALALNTTYSAIQLDSLVSIVTSLSIDIDINAAGHFDYIDEDSRSVVTAALNSVADQLPDDVQIFVLSEEMAEAAVYGGDVSGGNFMDGWHGVLDVDLAEAESGLCDTVVAYIDGDILQAYLHWVDAVNTLQMDGVDLSDPYDGVKIGVLPPGFWTEERHERMRQRSQECTSD